VRPAPPGETADASVAPLATRIVNECLDDLAAGGREAQIASRVGAPRPDIDAAIALIKSLNPNPVAEFDAIEPTDYVIPEINVVRGKSGRWVAVFDTDTVTRIKINDSLRGFLDRKDVSQEDKSYIRERLRSAEALSHCLEQRSDTVLQVGAAIVEEQQDFFTYGVARLKPMTLSDIAEKIKRHETTIGRAVEGKYLRSPRGIFELKYFFSTGIKSSGAAVSNKAVMDRILSIVRNENPAEPLSDQDILGILHREGIDIKRRTVAKYRDTLHIPASGKRRRSPSP
jgi:RNA polymerase sigma-54 factor